MRLAEHFFLFRNEFIEFNNTGARKLDSISYDIKMILNSYL